LTLLRIDPRSSIPFNSFISVYEEEEEEEDLRMGKEGAARCLKNHAHDF
jgi:hypothetical protein